MGGSEAYVSGRNSDSCTIARLSSESWSLRTVSSQAHSWLVSDAFSISRCPTEDERLRRPRVIDTGKGESWECQVALIEVVEKRRRERRGDVGMCTVIGGGNEICS